jgi:hypothetical protein
VRHFEMDNANSENLQVGGTFNEMTGSSALSRAQSSVSQVEILMYVFPRTLFSPDPLSHKLEGINSSPRTQCFISS